MSGFFFGRLDDDLVRVVLSKGQEKHKGLGGCVGSAHRLVISSDMVQYSYQVAKTLSNQLGFTSKKKGNSYVKSMCIYPNYFRKIR